jgi:osmotically-inducible protein OsmY
MRRTAVADGTEGRDRTASPTEVRARLDEDCAVGALARYEVSVLGGCAVLVGHVRSRELARAMAETARGVEGVAAVDERLVADDELELSVARAIAGGGLNRTTRLVVRAELGHVRIGGLYPSPEARDEALRLGAGVPGVVVATAAPASELVGS